MTVSNGVAAYTYAYDADTLLPVSETTAWDVNGDLVPDAASSRTRSVTRDSILRETGWDLGGEHAVSQAFDSAGRLASVTANGVTHAVGYAPSSDLVASVSSPGLSVTRSWEAARDILSGVSASGASTVSHAYVNDAAGLRRSADASYPGQAASTGDLSWLRDAAGRVTRETGTLPSTSSWTYDNAGNRLTAASGGTTLSLTTDSLNRYVSTGSGNATHDADGNLTYDPQVPRAVSPACKFTWDAENRMTEARNYSGVSQVKLGYDAYGRLVRREHTSPLSVGAGRSKVELYAHVGGLRVAVYSGNTSTKAVTLVRAIAWGPDLSGTVGGAGGIGGLLSVRETSASTSSRKGLTMLLGHDAKGDVTSVWSQDGAYLGGYVTQAFGQVTILSGANAYLSENQWRLASKPLEWLTGYSHWGRRWFSPFLGRWVSRDPIGENGGVNLYGACGNDPVSWLDPWGERLIEVQVNAYIAKRLDDSPGCTANGEDWFGEPYFSGIRFGGVGIGEDWLAGEWEFMGDNREQGMRGTSRLSVIILVDTDRVGANNNDSAILGIIKTGDISTRRFRENTGEVIEREESDPQDNPVRGTVGCEKTKDGEKVSVNVSRGYPFSPRMVTPDIDVDIDLTFKRNKDGSVALTASGEHNIFPNYEILVDGSVFYGYKTSESGPGYYTLSRSRPFLSEGFLEKPIFRSKRDK